MNVKLYLNGIVRIIDNRVPIHAVHKQLAPLADQIRLCLPMPQAGSNYLQWSLPGNDWRPFSQAAEEEKKVIALLYQQRREQLMAVNKQSPILEAALTTPAEDFIYFRKNGTDYDLALVAWGYRYPNQRPCMELNTWIQKTSVQEVRIGFEWGGCLLENLPFYLDNFERKTAADGMFYVGVVPVGKEFTLRTVSGSTFVLVVEQGKADYVFDLTQHVFVDIAVRKDNEALKDCPCEVFFNGNRYQLVTDSVGTVSLKMPLVCTPLGELLQTQPACQVTCQSEQQEQTPCNDGDRLAFNFLFQTEQPKKPVYPDSSKVDETKDSKVPQEDTEEEELVPELQFVEIKLLDYGGYLLPDLDFTLVTKKKGEVPLRTDANGVCIVPQEWFTGKEKFRIKFTVSPEYQQKHDLHGIKNKKKYGKRQ